MSSKEIAIAKTADLADGEMKQLSANGTEILLARVKGNFHAVAAHCTHYGAPLVEGVLNGDRIICPWHHACFDVTTGDMQEPPALDSLPCFEVKIENDQIIVRIPDEASDRRTPQMTKRQTAYERLFVIAGAGAVACAAAQTLREDGYTGRIVMITREKHLPYDRPNLSKDYLQGNAEPDWLPLRSEDFFVEHDIEVVLGKEIIHLDANRKSLSFPDGEVLACDALLVATGGKPRSLPFQHMNQENVFLLRSYDDCNAIVARAEEEARVVVIGASFIGMEVAASLTTRGCRVTVVAPNAVPFEKTLGTEIGQLFQQLHESNGVTFKLGRSVSGFTGDKKVTSVILDNGERLDADFVVVGIGVKPATDFLDHLVLHEDGGVVVDEYMRAADGVYAAGDIAHFPTPLTGEAVRIEHWRTAMQQGRIAAHNMAGKKTAYEGVPFFWTRQFDVGLLYVGHAKRWDQIIYRGTVATRDFLAFYIDGGRVLAAAGMNRDQEMAAIEELLRLNQMPEPDQLTDPSVSFRERLKATAQASSHGNPLWT